MQYCKSAEKVAIVVDEHKICNVFEEPLKVSIISVSWKLSRIWNYVDPESAACSCG